MKPATLAAAATTLLLLVLAGTGVLVVSRLANLFPLEHDVTAENSTGDDWLVYHRYAISVLNDGLTMPAVRQGYFRPAGFAYPYVIALIYGVAGVRSEAVYLVQAILLLATVVGMWAVFRPRASPLVGVAFLAALAVVMYLDVFRSLTFRLLAENLVLPLWPVLLFFALKGESTGKFIYFGIAGAVSGLCFLMRGNLVFVGPAIAAVVWRFRSAWPRPWQTRSALALLVGWMALASLMPLRNFVVTRQLELTVLTQPTDWSVATALSGTELSAVERVSWLVKAYARRAAYTVGIPYFLQPGFRIRFHWLVIWGGFFWYLRGVVRRSISFWEALAMAAAAAYFIPIFTLGYVSSYATRPLAPGLPLILLLACRGLDLSIADSFDAHRPGDVPGAPSIPIASA